MDEGNRYFPSEWRRDPDACPGCFLMDSAVHYLAAVRAVAAGAGLGEPVAASADAWRR